MNVLEQRQAEAVVSIAKTLRTPDWEQRRYEIAKAAMAGHQTIYEAKKLASTVVQYAGTLIEKLKKEINE